MLKKIFLLLGVVLFAAATPSFANTAAKKAAATAKAAADKKAADRAKKDADEESKLQEHLSYLQKYLPTLNASDLKGISDTDLRDLYSKAYQVQGMNLMEAKAKAEALSL